MAEVALTPEIGAFLREFCAERNLLRFSELVMIFGHEKLLVFFNSSICKFPDIGQTSLFVYHTQQKDALSTELIVSTCVVQLSGHDLCL